MTFDPDKHHRRSIRFKGYDYSRAGAYFVTICTHGRECLFGEVMDGEMRLNDAGQAAQADWVRLPERFQSIELDEFVIMPNHLHGIIILAPAPASKGAASSAPTLGQIIRAFKSLAAIEANRILGSSGRPFWQRNYYEHVIRDEDELNIIRQYIRDNPLKWDLDPDNPANAS